MSCSVFESGYFFGWLYWLAVSISHFRGSPGCYFSGNEASESKTEVFELSLTVLFLFSLLLKVKENRFVLCTSIFIIFLH